MNKIAKLFVIAGVTFVLACGSKGPGTDAATEQARLDSIKNAEASAVTAPVEGAVDAGAKAVEAGTEAVKTGAEATAGAAKEAGAKAVEAGADAVKAGAEKVKDAVKK